MTLTEIINQRHSCREYEEKQVSDDLIRRIINVARNAPSARNLQEWRFVAVTDRDTIARITEDAGKQEWWRGVPAMIACCADTNNHVMRCKQLCYPIDLAIIIDHMTLLATEAGLATCWIGAFDEDVVKDVCAIPRHIRVVELLALGYPADSPEPKSRLPLEEILYREKWGEAY